MGRLEALIVTALGRSPYDDGVIQPTTSSSEISESGGIFQRIQLYDDRGHPINLETRQRIRDHVRASNEVMQAVGIVEDTAAIRERDKAEEDIFAQETDAGLQRLEIGKFLCVAGVWGVCGLRRRILLYKSYSGIFSDIVRNEIRRSSVSHLMGAGFPALLMYQVVEWTRGIAQGALGEIYRDENGRLKAHRPSKLSLLWGFDRVVAWVSLNYNFFAILQQLDVVPNTRFLPGFKSFIPFSSSSPLRAPPISLFRLGLAGLLPWTYALLWGLAPLASVLIHSAVDTYISRILYHPVYRLLPGPSNSPKRQEQNLIESSEILDQSRQNVEDTQAASTGADAIAGVDSTEWDLLPTDTPSATLQALEGQPADPTIFSNGNRNHERESSDDESDGNEMSQQTVITFDIEAEHISDPEAPMGAWSAELRNTNENENDSPKPQIYRITPLTMLPLLLAVDSLLAILTHIFTLPLEAAMVRIIGHAYGVDRDMYTVGFGVSWKSIGNLMAVYSIELAVSGIIWTGFTLLSQISSKKFRPWKEDELD